MSQLRDRVGLNNFKRGNASRCESHKVLLRRIPASATPPLGVSNKRYRQRSGFARRGLRILDLVVKTRVWVRDNCQVGA